MGKGCGCWKDTQKIIIKKEISYSLRSHSSTIKNKFDKLTLQYFSNCCSTRVVKLSNVHRNSPSKAFPTLTIV